MSDQDTIEKLVLTVGVGRVTSRQKPNFLWKWEIYRKDEVKQAIQMFMPYLGSRRRTRAQEVLDHIENNMPGTGRSREAGIRQRELLKKAGFR